MELRRRVLEASLRDPARGFEETPVTVEVRWDPLTGHTSRLVAGGNPIDDSDFDLEGLARRTRPDCPFCPENLERLTPKLPEKVLPEGRIRVGAAVLFPNLLTLSKYTSVSVYSPELHYLPLGRMTPRLVADNLGAQVAFAKAVTARDPEAAWAWIDANHMPPSGSSVFHPHWQGGVDPFPTTFQALLVRVPPERFREYLETERKDRRHLGSAGNVEWLASFAPLGPAELRAFLPGIASPVALTPDLVEEMGQGIATALNLYAELGFESFNLAIYGAPHDTPGYPLNLRMVCRQNPQPLYRSDATHFERLQWETVVGITPEELAERAGDRFRR